MKNYSLKVDILIFSFIVLILALGFGFSGTVNSQSTTTEVKEGQTTICTFNNTHFGALQIIKKATGVPADFYYHIDAMPTPSILKIRADKPTSIINQYTNPKEITRFPPGNHKISELVPSSNWIMKSVSCTLLPLGCGDNVCDGLTSESCSTCSADCGACPPLPSSLSPPPPPPPPPPGTPTGTAVPGENSIENVSIIAGRNTACTFENKLITLKIVNQTIGGDGTEAFDYNIKKYSSSSPSVASSSLNVKADKIIREDKDRGDEYIGSDGTYLEPAITSYVITEEIPEDWALNSVVCQLQDGKKTGVPTIYNYGVINVTIESDEITKEPNKITTCTFINTKKGELEIVKKAENSKGDEKFDYDINFISSEYLPQTILSFPSPPTTMTVKANEEGTEKIYPGVYRVIEKLPKTSSNKESWMLNSLNCNLENGDSTGQNTLGGAENVYVFAGKKTTCTFENVLRLIEPQKSGGGGGGNPQEELKTGPP